MKAVIVIIVLVVAVLGFSFIYEPGPGKLDAFAQCLTDSKTIFYGAFWCPNCIEQKAMFGRSVTKIPYLECSTRDGRAQIQECNDAGIDAYPTWEFPGGERVTGTLPLETLAEKSGCELAN